MMFTYANILAIANKAERLHIFEFAYPVVIEGHLGLRAEGRFYSGNRACSFSGVSADRCGD
jgi:hypothetical protein